MEHKKQHCRGRGRAAFVNQLFGSDGSQQLGRRGEIRNVSLPEAPIGVGRASSDQPKPSTAAENPSGAVGGVAGFGNNRGSVLGKSIRDDIMCTRPEGLVSKIGTAGRQVGLTTNHYRLLRRPTWAIYMYRTDFSPEVDAIHLRRKYLGEHRAKFGGYVYDGTVMFCTVHVPDPMELMCKNAAGEPQVVKVKYVGKVEDTDHTKLQVLNLILRGCMRGLKLQLVGRNFFDAIAKVSMQKHRMEIWPGYLTSIRQHETDVMFCVEIAHKVMRTDSIYQIMRDCTNNAADFQMAFKHAVIGSVVLTGYNNKTYRVDDVDFNVSPMTTFQAGDKEISFVDYYKQRYNLQIRDKEQPMLVSRATERAKRAGQDESILLVPELCRATGLTDTMRADWKLMKDMSEHTRLSPQRRIERLMNFNRRLQETKESIDYLSTWDMELDTNLVEVPARILPAQRIFFGDSKQYICDSNVDWSREFQKKAMYTQIAIKRWAIIVPRRNVHDIQEFINSCGNVARNMNMVLGQPQYCEMPDDRNSSYNRAIEAAASKDPQILLIVLPNINEDKYSCVKKKCCVDRPVPSQVVTLKIIAPRDQQKRAALMSIATKVVIQMNAKLLGAPWMIDLPLKGLMTIGFDVCHSSKDSRKSYGAFVASMDLTNCASFYSCVTPHEKGQELSSALAMNLGCALRAYRARYNALPSRVLFYRDGVGDGQLHQIFTSEVKTMRDKINEIYRSNGVEGAAKFAFVVVSKRINTRFFLDNQNPPPGTVVDDVVTLPEHYDFFLVSQSVRHGTVSPTRYNVIYDTMGLPADRMQQLTYKMTHLYFNWPGACRVPAVCQYAHKLAFLVGEHVNRAPNRQLENQLYFL